jgi:hypothetical protein
MEVSFVGYRAASRDDTYPTNHLSRKAQEYRGCLGDPVPGLTKQHATVEYIDGSVRCGIQSVRTKRNLERWSLPLNY